MAGPRTIKNPGNGGVRVREDAGAGAPIRVSGQSKAHNVPSNPKSARNLQGSPQPYANLPNRPSTSGGVSTRRPIERRGTEDDLHVHPLRANQLETTYYNFPLPGNLPTPAATPRSTPSRTYTPEIPEPKAVGSIHSHMNIGMALGSPSHQTTIWSPHVQFQAPSREYSPESLEDWQNSASYPKRKPSKWKKLGGLFGRKSSDSSVEYYQTQSEGQTMHGPDYTSFPEPPSEKPRGRARTNSERKILKHKPDMQRSNTVPMDFQFQESEELPKGPNQFPALAEIRPPQIKLEGGPLLDVDIPSIEMERYSVMFGNLIKPATSASALLARRQATLDKLKMVNEAIAEHERKEAERKSKLLRPRRATSPQPTKSPVISLFPMVPRAQRDGSSHIPYRSSPLHRSNTSPAALSPNRQTFEPLRHNEEEHTIMLAPTPTLKPSAVLTSPWSADDSFLALDSPNSMTSVEEVHDSAPLRPHLTEPKWDMISPRTIVEDPMKVKPLKISSKPNTQTHEVARKQPLQSSLEALAYAGAKDEAEELIRTAANVSIARQISVSRRQRQLLVPAKSRTANPGPVAVNEERPTGVERLQVTEKKQLTPRLVNVQARRAVKSERVLFDEA